MSENPREPAYRVLLATVATIPVPGIAGLVQLVKEIDNGFRQAKIRQCVGNSPELRTYSSWLMLVHRSQGRELRNIAVDLVLQVNDWVSRTEDKSRIRRGNWNWNWKLKLSRKPENKYQDGKEGSSELVEELGE
jgi:hypothetical protein